MPIPTCRQSRALRGSASSRLTWNIGVVVSATPAQPADHTGKPGNDQHDERLAETEQDRPARTWHTSCGRKRQDRPKRSISKQARMTRTKRRCGIHGATMPSPRPYFRCHRADRAAALCAHRSRSGAKGPREHRDTTTIAGQIGEEIGVSEWIEVTQAMIDKFADATGDHQFIHVEFRTRETDTVRGALSPMVS